MELPHPARREIQLTEVLGALGHPVRLAILLELRDGAEHFCGQVFPDAPKSTMTRHWRTLRQSGIIRQRTNGREFLVSVRRDDLDARFPGLLDAVFASAVRRSRGGHGRA